MVIRLVLSLALVAAIGTFAVAVPGTVGHVAEITLMVFGAMFLLERLDLWRRSRIR
jgi:hypothetical protein